MRLEGRALTIGYSGHVVGRGLDVALETGEVLALLGPNGGGKTTLLKTLLGLIKPHGGEVRLDGKPLGGIAVGERARMVAYVPQVHIGTFAFTVETVVLMGRTAHGNLFSRPSAHDRAVAMAALERFGIAPLKDRPYTQISGGERQLVLLARALAQEPHIILMDEPFTGVDASTQETALCLFKNLQKQHVTILTSTHDLNLAAQSFDRILLLNRRLIAFGPASQALTPEAVAEAFGGQVLFLNGALVVDKAVHKDRKAGS